MPLEVNDVLSVFGIKPEEVADTDQLKAKVESEFFRRNSVPTEVKKQITGALAGSTTDELKKLSSASGIEWDDTEVEKKPLEKVLSIIWNKREEKYKTEIESLREQVGKPDEAVSKLQKEKDKLEAKLQAESQKTTKLFEEFETFKTRTSDERNKEKLDFEVNKVYTDKIKFKKDITELEKEGYFRKVEKNYTPQLHESGQLIALDTTGNPLPGKAVGSFKLYSEVLEEVGVKNNVWEINPHAKNQQPVVVQPINEPAQPVTGRQRVIAKRIT